METRATQRISLAEQVAEILLSGDAYESQPLSEEHLAAVLGTSRTPVREALAELERAGMVIRRQKKGVYLRRPTIQEKAEFYDVRAALEGFAARRAASLATEEQLAELASQAEIYELAHARGDRETRLVADHEFHRAIVAIAGNTILERVFRQFWLLQKTFSQLAVRMPTTPGDTNSFSHAQIVAALRSRDPDEAERCLRGHIESVKQRVLAAAMDTGIGESQPPADQPPDRAVIAR